MCVCVRARRRWQLCRGADGVEMESGCSSTEMKISVLRLAAASVLLLLLLLLLLSLSLTTVSEEQSEQQQGLMETLAF